jgi:hypothetical protein
VQASTFVAIQAGALLLARRSARWHRGTWAAVSLLALTAFDLAVAHHWLVPTVPGVTFASPPLVGEQLTAPASASDALVPPRLLHSRSLFIPPSWKERASPRRLTEIVDWERNLLLHRHHLAVRAAALDAPTTFRPRPWLQFLQATPRRPPPKTGSPNPGSFDWLGLNYFLRVEAAIAEDRAAVVLENPAAWPRVWLASEAASEDSVIPDPTAGSCAVESYSPQRITVRCRLHRAAMLVLSDTWEPNWMVDCETEGKERHVAIHQVRGLVRGVLLPAGDHHLIFRYRPRMFYGGAALSLATWMGLAVWTGWSWRSRVRREAEGVMS